MSSPLPVVKHPIDTGLCFSPELLAELRRLSAGKVEAFWALLEERLRLPADVCAERLGASLHLPVLQMRDLHGLVPDFQTMGFAESSRRLCLVASAPPDTPIAVLADPFDVDLQTWVENRVGRSVHWHLAHPQDLVAWFAMQEDRLRAIDGALANVGSDASAPQLVDQLSLASIAQDTSPVVRLVNSTVFDAMKLGASDIHIETVATGLHVKYRIDGVLSSAAQVHGLETAEQVVSRVKVMAELDISERRVPQDGRFKVAVGGREVDFRVSVMPSLFGEDVVIRILDKRSLTDQVQGLRLDLLGFEVEMLRRLRQLAREPYGMLLVTGPTGSGKTTTLYAALTEINSGQDKIVTIEDPVEYELPGILQIPVNEKKGLTFARGLRSILRHDPDKILVGEIRDPETAQIAIQSALTGHLVFTSVHANNVFDVLGRFLHMGVDTYSFVSALNGVLAQRLVRVICSQCIEPMVATAEAIQSLGLDVEPEKPLQFYCGKGCGACRGTGYKGRRAISELLRLNDELRELIIARAPIRTIKEAALANGTRFLRQSAVAAVLAGWTTVEEMDRVTFAQ